MSSESLQFVIEKLSYYPAPIPVKNLIYFGFLSSKNKVTRSNYCCLIESLAGDQLSSCNGITDINLVSLLSLYSLSLISEAFSIPLAYFHAFFYHTTPNRNITKSVFYDATKQTGSADECTRQRILNQSSDVLKYICIESENIPLYHISLEPEIFVLSLDGQLYHSHTTNDQSIVFYPIQFPISQSWVHFRLLFSPFFPHRFALKEYYLEDNQKSLSSFAFKLSNLFYFEYGVHVQEHALRLMDRDDPEDYFTHLQTQLFILLIIIMRSFLTLIDLNVVPSDQKLSEIVERFASLFLTLSITVGVIFSCLMHRYGIIPWGIFWPKYGDTHFDACISFLLQFLAIPYNVILLTLNFVLQSVLFLQNFVELVYICILENHFNTTTICLIGMLSICLLSTAKILSTTLLITCSLVIPVLPVFGMLLDKMNQIKLTHCVYKRKTDSGELNASPPSNGPLSSEHRRVNHGLNAVDVQRRL